MRRLGFINPEIKKKLESIESTEKLVKEKKMKYIARTSIHTKFGSRDVMSQKIQNTQTNGIDKKELEK